MFKRIKILSLKETKKGLVPVSCYWSAHKSKGQHVLVRLPGATRPAWISQLSKICQVGLPMGSAVNLGAKSCGFKVPGAIPFISGGWYHWPKPALSQPHLPQLRERRTSHLSLAGMLRGQAREHGAWRMVSAQPVWVMLLLCLEDCSVFLGGYCATHSSPSPSWLKPPSSLTPSWPSSTLQITTNHLLQT